MGHKFNILQNLEVIQGINKAKYVGEYKDAGSKFIAIGFYIKEETELKIMINHAKEIYPKASHYCFAYRMVSPSDNYRCADDGEPKYTAGKPILHVIDSYELRNILVVVVRYFGGKLLGKSGLIKAYSQATENLILANNTIEKEIDIICKVEFDYSKMNLVQKVFKKNTCLIQSQEIINNEVIIIVEIAQSKYESVVASCQEFAKVIELNKKQ